MKRPDLFIYADIVVSEFRKNHGMQRASAMAYTTLLALVPLITLSFSLFTHFVELSKIKEKIQHGILAHFIPRTGSELFDTVMTYLDTFMANAAAINALGVAGLALTSIALFTAVENSFNFIWRVEKQRSFFSRYNAFCGMLIGMPLLMGSSLYVSSIFNVQSLGHTFAVMEKFLFTVFPLMLTWAAFILLYHQVPYTKVQWGPAILSGIFAGTLWEIAKFAFSIYVSKSVTVSVVYGSLGAVLLFLAWLYFTWVIVLLGTQMTYVAQHFKALAQEREGGKLS